MFLRTLRALSIPLLIVWASTWGCAQRNVRLGDAVEDGGTIQSFTPVDTDGGLDASTPPESRLMCVATECPAPFATCPSGDVDYKCSVDLSRDPDNCGACGNKCLYYKSLHLNSRCVAGECEVECYNDVNDHERADYRNCNGQVDDGCEVDVQWDPNNCGACGKVCPQGKSCIAGKCGCAPGLRECPGPGGKPMCVDLDFDDFNCGACGKICLEDDPPPPGACKPMPPGTYYGCGGGKCEKLKCGGRSADCDQDLGTLGCQSNGCEVEDIVTDRDNCGGCGIKCAPDEQCVDEGNGYQCTVPCKQAGKTKCRFGCSDLLNDPNNCGGCDDRCPNAGPNQLRLCKKGLCAFECASGFADCNGDPSDGCEVDLKKHPEHCGACGNSCDIAAGQPCVSGKCLMVECDGGLPPQ